MDDWARFCAPPASHSRLTDAGNKKAAPVAKAPHAKLGPHPATDCRQVMEFRILYFGSYDSLLYAEKMDVEKLDDALSRARSIVYEHDPAFADPAITGYVIVDERGRLVARGYKR